MSMGNRVVCRGSSSLWFRWGMLCFVGCLPPVLTGCYGTAAIVAALLSGSDDDSSDAPTDVEFVNVREAGEPCDVLFVDGFPQISSDYVELSYRVCDPDTRSATAEITMRLLDVDSRASCSVPEDFPGLLERSAQHFDDVSDSDSCKEVTRSFTWDARASLVRSGLVDARVLVEAEIRVRGIADREFFWLDYTPPPTVELRGVEQRGEDGRGSPPTDRVYWGTIALRFSVRVPCDGARPETSLLLREKSDSDDENSCEDDRGRKGELLVTLDDNDGSRDDEMVLLWQSEERGSTRAGRTTVPLEAIPFSTRRGDAIDFEIQVDNSEPEIRVTAPTDPLSGRTLVDIALERRDPRTEYSIQSILFDPDDGDGGRGDEIGITPAVGPPNGFYDDPMSHCGDIRELTIASGEKKTFVWNVPRDLDGLLSVPGLDNPIRGRLRVTLRDPRTGRAFESESDGITLNADLVSTVAGGGSGGSPRPRDVVLIEPSGVAYDEGGDTVYVVDTASHRVLAFTAGLQCESSATTCPGVDAGEFQVVAGNGFAGFEPGIHPAAQTSLRSPVDVAVAPDGRIYIADTGNDLVRFVDPEDNSLHSLSESGEEELRAPRGIAIQTPDPVGDPTRYHLYIADTGQDRVIRRTPGEAGSLLVLARIPTPVAVAAREEDGVTAVYVVTEATSRDEADDTCTGATSGGVWRFVDADMEVDCSSVDLVDASGRPLALAATPTAVYVADALEPTIRELGMGSSRSPVDAECRQEGDHVVISWSGKAPGDACVQVTRTPPSDEAFPSVSFEAGEFVDRSPGPGTYTYAILVVAPSQTGVCTEGQEETLLTPTSLLTCEITVPVAVDPPFDLTCVPDGRDARLSFTPAMDYDAIEIERETQRGGTTSRRTFLLPGDATEFTDRGLDFDLVYSYRVRGTREGQRSAPRSCQLQLGVIESPRDLHCDSTRTGTLTLTWSNPVTYDTVRLERTGGQMEELRLQLPGDAEEFVDFGIPPGHYAYTLRGVLAGRESSPVRLECTLEGEIESVSDLVVELVDCPQARGRDCAGTRVPRLRWRNPFGGYDAVLVNRNPPMARGSVLLDGDATAFVDAEAVEPDVYTYWVQGVLGRKRSVRVARTLVWPVLDLSCGGCPGSAVCWTNPPSFEYDSIVVERVTDKGRMLFHLPGDRESLFVPLAGAGDRFAVSGVVRGESSPPESCGAAEEIAALRKGATRSGCDVRSPTFLPSGIAPGPCGGLLIVAGRRNVPQARRQLFWRAPGGQMTLLAGSDGPVTLRGGTPARSVDVTDCGNSSEEQITIAGTDDETVPRADLPAAATEVPLGDPRSIVIQESENRSGIEAVFIAETLNDRILRLDGCTGVLRQVEVSGETLRRPMSLAMGTHGVLYVAHAGPEGYRISSGVVEVQSSGAVKIASLERLRQTDEPAILRWRRVPSEGLYYACGLTVGFLDAEGTLRFETKVRPSYTSGDEEIRTSNLGGAVSSLAVDPEGALFVAGNFAVTLDYREPHRVTSDTRILRLSEASGPAGEPRLDTTNAVLGFYASTCDQIDEHTRDFADLVGVQALAFTPRGDLVIAEESASGSSLISLVPASEVRRVFEGRRPRTRRLLAGGGLDPFDPSSPTLIGVNRDGRDPRVTLIGAVASLAVDSGGNIYFSQLMNPRIRRFHLSESD